MMPTDYFALHALFPFFMQYVPNAIKASTKATMANLFFFMSSNIRKN